MTFLLSSVVLSCESDVHYVHSTQISWSPERSATPNGCKGKQIEMEKQKVLGIGRVIGEGWINSCRSEVRCMRCASRFNVDDRRRSRFLVQPLGLSSWYFEIMTLLAK